MKPGFDGVVRRASNALCAPVTLGSFAAVFVASLGAGSLVRVLWGCTVLGAGGRIAGQGPAMQVTGEH